MSSLWSPWLLHALCKLLSSLPTSFDSYKLRKHLSNHSFIGQQKFTLVKLSLMRKSWELLVGRHFRRERVDTVRSNDKVKGSGERQRCHILAYDSSLSPFAWMTKRRPYLWGSGKKDPAMSLTEGRGDSPVRLAPHQLRRVLSSVSFPDFQPATSYAGVPLPASHWDKCHLLGILFKQNQ